MPKNNQEDNLLDNCCPAWERAIARGSDNEGYGALIWYSVHTKGYYMGASLPVIRFCPWCGKSRT